MEKISGKRLGIDIGSCSLKLAVCKGGKLQQLVDEHMPDSLVKDGRVISAEAMAEFLKTTLKKNHIRTRSCAMIVPPSQVFVRQTTVPAMSEEHLKLNLPYEFRDFISDDSSKYFYDYAVTGLEHDESGKVVKLQLIAAAARKELISEYYDICRWAGLSLKVVIPTEMALTNLLRQFDNEGDSKSTGEQCIVDLGHTGTRAYFFSGDRLSAVRTAERGGADMDAALAEALNTDIHIAQTRKELNTDSALENPQLLDVVRDISTDIMRAVNFYAYNNRESELAQGWLCGGGSRISTMRGDIQNVLNFPLAPLSELIKDSPDGTLTDTCFAAIGAALQ